MAFVDATCLSGRCSDVDLRRDYSQIDSHSSFLTYTVDATTFPVCLTSRKLAIKN